MVQFILAIVIVTQTHELNLSVLGPMYDFVESFLF